MKDISLIETIEDDPLFEAARKRLSGKRYLLSAVVPYFQDDAGAIWLDPLWRHDLLAHLDYLDHLTVLAPMARYDGQSDLEPLNLPQGQKLEFRALPFAESGKAALLQLPIAIWSALKAVRAADIVHTGVAGWPVPQGLFVNPIAVMLRKPMVVVIESAFWRIADAAHASRKARLRERLTEAFARWSIRKCKLAIFTHQKYRAELGANSKARLEVHPASWVNEADVFAPDEARARWSGKADMPKFLVAARLVPEKGIPVLLEALHQLEASGEAIDLTIMGEGALKDECHQAAARFRQVRLTVKAPLPYGAPFFEELARYHAIVVPSVSDEQPRILFDAFARAVPALASDTDGHRDLVEPQRTGALFAAGEPAALAKMLVRYRDRPDDLHAMGLTALEQASGHTHRAMHAKRAGILAELFA